MKRISRRDFLKGSAAMGMLAAINAPVAVAEETYTYADTVKWDAQYDVVVLGMGFAGMNAAVSAADAGASVLLCEKAPESAAGGNSRVCGQFFAYGHKDYESTKAYYMQMNGDREVSEPVLDTVVQGVTNMWDTIKDKYFNGNDSEFMDWTGLPVIGVLSPEYPEFTGSDKIGLCSTHAGASDAFLYNTVKNAVYERKEKIDVWYESPAIELIQEPQSKTVIGVKVSRKGETRLVRANNGVCICTGGFENNREMAQNYLNLVNYSVMGGLFNTGDGIKMCQDIGAKLWHMGVFEGGAGTCGCGFKVEKDMNAAQVGTLLYTSVNTGALVFVGADGSRFCNESELPRHGHFYDCGAWENPKYSHRIYMIMDQLQYDTALSENQIPEASRGSVIQAATIEELAEKTGCTFERLKDTIESYNSFAINGKDYKHGRAPEYMRAFDGNAYYAFEMMGTLLNTQGGPMRNENAEILDMDGMPIPHLYSAGEMGGITAFMYQGGTNVAECFIFGEIAGRNAAAAKDALPAYALSPKIESTPLTLGMDTDIGAAKSYEAADNQYIGTSTGMSDIAVRVTMTDGKISTVEIIEQNETAGIGSRAIESIPNQFIGLSTAEEIDAIDSISGATLTSGALKEAVKAALAQVK